MASNAMLWELTKNFNSFLVKRRDCGAMLSSDPFNLTNEHCAKQAGLAHTRGLGLTLEVKEGQGKKKKGPKVVYKVMIKRKKQYLGKKAKAPHQRNRNSFTTELPLKKGVHQAANVIQKMTHFRKDLHKDALKRAAVLHKVAVRKTAIKKIEKPQEKMTK